MNHTATKIRNTDDVVTLKTSDARRLFTISSALADFIEGILENQGAYNKEFISGLQRSAKQAKNKNLIRIDSLIELLT